MKNLQNSGLTRGKPGRRTRKPLAGARRRRRLGNEAAQSPKIRERRRKSPQEIRLGSFPGEEPAEVDGRSGSGNEGCGREGEEKTCGLRPRREESRLASPASRSSLLTFKRTGGLVRASVVPCSLRRGLLLAKFNRGRFSASSTCCGCDFFLRKKRETNLSFFS
jgi:hypothetical protein